MNTAYLFTSSRLGFRNWKASDLTPFAAMNANAEVMRFFPTLLTPEESEASVERFKQQLHDIGYTYYAVDELGSGEFIGFIGLSWKDFESPFTPATDIGWRLKPAAWGKGYATEGAKRCLEYAFQELNLEKVIAICPAVNTPSERVMQKIGMQLKGRFDHPFLQAHPKLQPCLCYAITGKEL
ncbi:Protein N-acetyltransferase, RimJ/RimL family [Lishizhenia tianjinensis]|uniref:Protein N-acetyltransferase, RimJ/RimL family n=1 Tax=Lishizhenia tianjinensis TaxID=477690 RepID=A0A1I6XVE9_9FLAO|nr:GNAT family N-acetyltransferase [Lishizhenia tianjinensis]SFT42067.1 Protein N-acetyltransferase, RimJ/RimL family [Lishizhenia tianjinensis]